MIEVGSRARATEERALTETRNCVGTVIEYRREGERGSIWLVRWSNEDTGGYGEYEMECYTDQLIAEMPPKPKDDEQYFTVLRCVKNGGVEHTPGTYLGKNGRGNATFAKAMLLSPKGAENYLGSYFGKYYEAVTATLREPK